MTQRIVERCKRAKLVDEVVVATPFDDAEEIGRAVDCPVVAPQLPEDDLIARYYTVAAGMKADLVVRVSGDNPCVEPEEIDNLVDHAQYIHEPCRSLFTNAEDFKYDHDGFGGELYTLEMLEWMDRFIKEPKYREHPHKFWAEMNCYSYCGNFHPRGFRLDVNDQADYEKIKNIYEALYPTKPNFSMKDVLAYIETARPMWATLEYLNGKNDLEKWNLPAGK